MGYISDIRNKVGHDPIFMPSAGGCIYKDGNILLQKRTDSGEWALHGGCLELGDTFYQALVRELKEEINIDVKKATPIAILSGKKENHIYPNEDETYGIDMVFMVDEYEGIPTPDNIEVSDLKWFPLDNLPENLHEPDINFFPILRNYLENKGFVVDW